MFGKLGVLNTFSAYDIFSLLLVYWKCDLIAVEEKAAKKICSKLGSHVSKLDSHHSIANTWAGGRGGVSRKWSLFYFTRLQNHYGW